MLGLRYILVPALLLMNAGTILSFWDDKRRAVESRRRIRESDLLALP